MFNNWYLVFIVGLNFGLLVNPYKRKFTRITNLNAYEKQSNDFKHKNLFFNRFKWNVFKKLVYFTHKWYMND